MKSDGKFGLWSIVLLGINSVVGSGIFLLPGQVSVLVGSWSLLVFLTVTFAVIAIALCFAECATHFNKNGAAYVYSKEAFGDFVGFQVGIMKWAVGIISWAALLVGFVTALGTLIPALNEEPWRSSFIFLVLSSLAIMNILGIEILKYLNNVLTIAKLLPLFLVVSAGVFFIKGSNLVSLSTEFPTGEAFGAASLLIFYAFSGFETLAVAAEDMRNPQKHLPIALVIVMIFCSALYCLLQIVAIGTLGPDLTTSVTPLVDVAEKVLGTYGKAFVVIGALISMAGINVAASFVTPRSGVALAKDGMVPTLFASQSRFGTPYAAILATVTLTGLLTFTGTFFELAVISVIARFAQFLPTCAAVFVLRRKNPDVPALLPKPWHAIVPLIALATTFWFLTKASSFQLFWGLGALLAGVPFYFLYFRLRLLSFFAKRFFQ